MLPIIGQTANSTIMCHCLTSSAYIAIFKRTLISGANKLSTSGPTPLRAKKKKKVCSKENETPNISDEVCCDSIFSTHTHALNNRVSFLMGLRSDKLEHSVELSVHYILLHKLR